ncbi:MAG TPA: bifunctional diguanylate cyclase/phosphodiesterase, partial [Methylibium sp.]|uniref:putative bifunctional diguanylate cyclase/phosphodiesterase n=1 Tax=Methylibium sp. TaxID=2067992 RepID=UPI002DBC77DE
VRGAHGALAALLLALGGVGSALLCIADLQTAHVSRWQPLWVAAGVAAITLAGALCRPLDAVTVADGRRVGRLASPLLLGAGIALGHRCAVLAAPLAARTLPAADSNGHALALLAVGGSGTLIVVMTAFTLFERRMQRALRRAVLAMEASASTDALTGLANFAAFERRLADAAGEADADRGTMTLLYVALDGLKPINESFGRAVGDALLKEVARRLVALRGTGQELARVGGDEFALLWPGECDRERLAGYAQRVLAAVSQPTAIDGGPAITLSCSIGLVSYPQHGAHTLMLVQGETAAQAVKKAGGGAAGFFHPRMLSGTREQLELLQDLRQAVGARQLELHYQPKIDAASGAVTGCEALMRWNHPKRGMVSPGTFIPLAERHGLITALGDWLIDEACRQIRAWRDEGLRMRVAINLSVHQLRQPDLAQCIARALDVHRINAQLLTCEITESLAMEDSAQTMRCFEQLARVGVRLSIDDFGTGYSSLAYLRKLPAEELKIDRSFVLDLETSADARAVVDAVVKLAQALGLKVVAEGVETEGQQRILRALGCDQLQGFLFGKPMPAQALGVWAMTDEGPSALAFRPSLFGETQPAELH